MLGPRPLLGPGVVPCTASAPSSQRMDLRWLGVHMGRTRGALTQDSWMQGYK